MLAAIFVIKTTTGIIVLISQILIHMLFLLDKHRTVIIIFTEQEQDTWIKSISILQAAVFSEGYNIPFGWSRTNFQGFKQEAFIAVVV